MKEYTILVTGGRDYFDFDKVEKVLGQFIPKDPNLKIVLVHGDAAGLDTVAGFVAKQYGFEVKPEPADWDKYKKSAGPVRNKKMLDDYPIDIVIAFPGGSGTANMVKQARAAGFEPMMIEKDL